LKQTGVKKMSAINLVEIRIPKKFPICIYMYMYILEIDRKFLQNPNLNEISLPFVCVYARMVTNVDGHKHDKAMCMNSNDFVFTIITKLIEKRKHVCYLVEIRILKKLSVCI
jgi:hypothetical protein